MIKKIYMTFSYFKNNLNLKSKKKSIIIIVMDQFEIINYMYK